MGLHFPKKSFLRFAILLVTFLSFQFSFQSFASSTTFDAVLSGRIKDKKTGEYLTGVSVQLKGSTLKATTNSEGLFIFANFPDGSQTLFITYLGFSNKEVEVSAVRTAQELSIELVASSTNLKEVVVSGLRRSQIQSINTKKEALNIKEVITANEAGRLPDINVAEATQRVSGVSIETDRGEGQFVSIRGIQPSLNNVTLNNSSLASTRDSRATGLDLLPTEIISSIEVIKTNTPDMEANSIGGTVNITTLSAFDRINPFFNIAVDGLVQTQQVDLAGFDNTRAPFRGAVTAGKKFGKKEKFGVVASANFFRRDFSASMLDPDGWEFNNFFYPNETELQIEDNERDRLGLSADFEYRPSKNSSVYLKTLYTRTREVQLNSEFEITLQIGNAAPLDQTPTTGRFARASGELDQAETDEVENLHSYTLGTKNRFGKLSTDIYGTFSKAKTNLSNFDATFENPIATEPSLASTYDTGPFFFNVTPINRAFASDPENYKLRNLNFTKGILNENIYELSADLKYEFNINKTNAFIKFGGRYRDRSKNSDRSRDSYDLSFGGVTIPNANGYSLTPFYYPVSVPVQGGATPFVHGRVNTFKDFISNPSNVNNTSKLLFDKLVTDQQLYLNDFATGETVTAAYVMGVIDFKKLTIVTGLRVENTITRSENTAIATNRGIATPSVSNTSNNYTNLLPSIQFKYSPTKNIVARAAYTNTLARPNYSDLSGATNLNYTELTTPGLFTGSVRLANPNLKPYLSSNLDLTFEYYIPNGGILSVGGFYKKIQNQIYRFVDIRRDFLYEGRQYQQLTFSQTANSNDADLYGMEFSYEQTLTFLPGFLNGLGFSTNFALFNSRVTLPNRPNETLPLFRQANNVYNGALYYQKKGFELRFATSHRGQFLTEAATPVAPAIPPALPTTSIGRAVAAGFGVSEFDRYDAARTTYDVSAKYQFPNKKLSISAQIRNLSNAPEQGFQGAASRMDRHDLTGRSYFLGLALNL